MLHVLNLMGWAHCEEEEEGVAGKVAVVVEQDGMMMAVH